MNLDTEALDYYLTVATMVGPAFVGFFVLQYAMLIGRNRKRSAPLSGWGVAGRAAVGVIVGSAVGFGALWLTMYVPSYLTGDFQGLPWLMMFIAMPVGGLVALGVSHCLSRWLVVRARGDVVTTPAAP
ncbi:hypothetical protein [Lysobacter sp. ESA13C]|uniref:hypothetical protein n=1 Tax=Lysobacter sp. ESA13C TaxID=2862676 RepID=UPI001CC00A50|nr:hypothetical protein [Lysobacter sp. ESA13C]